MLGTASGSRRWSRPGHPWSMWAIITATGLVCLALFVWPVLMIVQGALREGQPGEAGSWSLSAVRTVLGDAQTYSTFKTSFFMALLVVLAGKSLAFYLAWLATRTDTPLRRMITPTMLITLAMPALFYAISWSLLGGARVGTLNKAVESLTSAESSLINVQSFGGVVFVTALKSVAFGYFVLLGPMTAMSRRLEEAAVVSGASKFRVFWTVNVPLMAPAFLASLILGFVVSLESFEVPLVLGTPAGVTVFSTRIYDYLRNDNPPSYAEASVIAVMVLLVLVVLLVIQQRLLRSRSFTTVGGKTENAEPWNLGRFRYVGTAVFLLYLTLAVILPVGQLALSSLLPFIGADSGLSFDNYTSLLSDPETAQALWNTAVLSVGAGLLVMCLGVAIAFSTRHAPPWARAVISRSTWAPWSVPGTALALGILWVLLSFDLIHPLYGTVGAMLIALVIVAIPVAMRTIEPAALQISGDLEEAARIAGAGPVRAYAAVVVRLLLPSFLSGWLLTGIIVGGNLTIPLLIGSSTFTSVPQLTYDLYGSGQGTAAAALSCVFLAATSAVFLAGIALRSLSARLVQRLSAKP